MQLSPRDAGQSASGGESSTMSALTGETADETRYPDDKYFCLKADRSSKFSTVPPLAVLNTAATTSHIVSFLKHLSANV